MNKKKIILISSVALVLILITIICVVVFGKDKNTSKDNNETTSKVSEVTSTEADTETNSKTETESSSEVKSTEELTTEEPTTEEPTTEQPTTKQEETTKGNGTYTYGQDIKNIDDAIAYFESLGYTFKDKANYNISVEEVNTIYKDFSHIMTIKELEGFLNLGPNFALLTLAQHSLPSDPNAVVQEQTTKEPSGYFVEDSYIKTDTQDEKETTSSTEEETTEPSIDDLSGFFPDDLDDLTPEDNIFQ